MVQNGKKESTNNSTSGFREMIQEREKQSKTKSIASESNKTVHK
jgi:hypothetical protein